MIPWYLMAKGKGGGGYKTASGPIVSVNDALAAPLRSLVANIDPVQAGTGDPSPDNVRPISGWSAVNVWRTGKNLVQNTGEDRTNANVEYTVNADGSVKAYGTATATSWWRGSTTLSGWRYIKAGTYRLTGGLSNNKMLYLVGQYVDGTFILNNTVIGGVYDKGSGLTFTLSKDAYINYQIQINNGTVADDTFYPMICRDTSAVASDFEPYTGTTYPITIPTPPGTVYGGYISVGADGSAELVVEKGIKDLGAMDWTHYGSGETAFFYSDSNIGVKPSTTNAISSMFRFGSITTTNTTNNAFSITGNPYVRIRCLDYSDATAFKTAVSGQTLVYELATPITLPLTPHEISTLAGQNVMWADCGDVTVEYLASGGADPDLMKLAVAFMGRK